MDEQLSFLAEAEVNVHLSHFSEPSESISVHGSVSAKGVRRVGIMHSLINESNVMKF